MATNTEKPTGKNEMKKAQAASAPKKADRNLSKAPVKTEENKSEKQEDKKAEIQKEEVKAPEKTEQKSEEKKTETKKTPEKKVSKDFAVVNASSVPVSTKYAVAICKFIKGKRVGDAIRDLEDVMKKRTHVPMIGEYGHKKGIGKFASGAGKYPVNASKHFIVLLKSLSGNSLANNIEEPVVSEAIANQASRPMGRFGRWERKRTHIKLVAREMKTKQDKKSKKKKVGGNK